MAKGTRLMNVNAKNVLWWSVLAGIGFTFGAGVARLLYLVLVATLAIDQILPWLGGLTGGQP